MQQVIPHPPACDQDTSTSMRTAVVAWVVAAIFYFYQYVLRSAPSVMMPQLSEAFGISSLGMASILGLFYYGYSPFSLVAGTAMDRLGPRSVLPIAAAVVGVGALLFATGRTDLGSVGRVLQGAGGVFALVGAIYIATRNFPASRAATLIGATQMFGMAGGSAGQFAVGPLISSGLQWDKFWLIMGLAGMALAGAMALTPSEQHSPAAGPAGSWMRNAITAFRAVFGNPQSILCGVIAGLLFIPTTIFGMVWGVQFLQEGHDLPYTMAVLRSASVSVGWMIGAPLLGVLSDRIGRRKPVIIGSAAVLFGCLLAILFGRPGLFPTYSLGLAAGIASGAAMIPYTIIKEANRPEYGGTATGVLSFINFSLSALLGPAFGASLARASGGTGRDLIHYQTAFTPLLYIVALAIILTFVLRETGPAAKSVIRPPAKQPSTSLP